jgi:general secretion pathway protein G
MLLRLDIVEISKYLMKDSKGFTLIELLVVIAIIGILSSVVLASLSGVRERAKMANAKSEMNQIKTAMEMYLIDNGELPPAGNICSACADPCTVAEWTATIDELVNGSYLSSRIDADPWGRPYCYDDNYKVANCALDSPLWTMGPDGVRDTASAASPTIFAGDDIGTIIEEPQC